MRGAGSVIFAGVLLMVVGTLDIIYGIAAISEAYPGLPVVCGAALPSPAHCPLGGWQGQKTGETMPVADANFH